MKLRGKYINAERIGAKGRQRVIVPARKMGEPRLAGDLVCQHGYHECAICRAACAEIVAEAVQPVERERLVQRAEELREQGKAQEVTPEVWEGARKAEALGLSVAVQHDYQNWSATHPSQPVRVCTHSGSKGPWFVGPPGKRTGCYSPYTRHDYLDAALARVRKLLEGKR